MTANGERMAGRRYDKNEKVVEGVAMFGGSMGGWGRTGRPPFLLSPFEKLG